MYRMEGYQDIIKDLYAEILALPFEGTQADYIPELAEVNPSLFGVYIALPGGKGYGIGDYQHGFSIQSMSKVFSLLLAYEKLGGLLWSRVGVEPSGTRFNSLVQLEADHGIPRNPFINAGAIVICDILLGLYDDPLEVILDFIRDACGDSTISFDEHIALSEKETAFRNYALCYFLKSYGNIHHDVDEVIDFYTRLCSIELNCEQSSKALLYLTLHGVHPLTGDKRFTTSQIKRINAIMQTCGFYDESGEFSYKVGLPGKSGVGGGIMALHPGLYSITTFSPLLNEKGNSVKGLAFLEAFTTRIEQSIF